MDTDLGNLIARAPTPTLTVHLGTSLPVGVPTLENLIDATFGGYAPALFTAPAQSQSSNGFSDLVGSVAYRCTDPGGFSAACLWVVSSALAVPVLVAYTQVDPSKVTLSGAGSISIGLSVSLFMIPAGF